MLISENGIISTLSTYLWIKKRL